jgi:hypothetical protein
MAERTHWADRAQRLLEESRAFAGCLRRIDDGLEEKLAVEVVWSADSGVRHRWPGCSAGLPRRHRGGWPLGQMTPPQGLREWTQSVGSSALVNVDPNGGIAARQLEVDPNMPGGRSGNFGI